MSRQDVSAERDLEEEGQIFASQEVFRHMQKQLDDCIRFHQQILRWVGQQTSCVNASDFRRKVVLFYQTNNSTQIADT